MSDNPFPKWNETATRGEVISALVIIQTGILQAQQGLIAQLNGDSEAGRKAAKTMSDTILQLTSAIYRIGGGVNPNA